MTAARIRIRLVASLIALTAATICASAGAQNTYLICNYPADQTDLEYGGTDSLLGLITTDGYTGAGDAAAHITGGTLAISTQAGSASGCFSAAPNTIEGSLIYTPDQLLVPQASYFSMEVGGPPADGVWLSYQNQPPSSLSYGGAMSYSQNTSLGYWYAEPPSGAAGSIAANDPWVVGLHSPDTSVATLNVFNGTLQLTHSSMNALLAPGWSWPVAPGDTITATASGSGSVVSPGGCDAFSIIDLHPGAALTMADDAGDVNLLHGLIETIQNLPNGLAPKVNTRNCSSGGIRGIDYTVSFAEANGWDTTAIYVNDGAVEVTGENGAVCVLTVGQSGTITSHVPELWQASLGGSWTNAASWSPQTSPNGAGCAVFGPSASSSCAITLDGNQTVGSLTFNNTAGYALSAGAGGSLTLNNSGGTGSQIVVLAGSHSIAAPVEIAGGDLTVTESSGGSLAISEDINDDNGAESLTLNGDGTGVLVLSGTNTYGGGTIVEDGTLVVTNPAALLAGGNLTVGTEAASIFTPVAPATQAGDATTAVPEPSTLVLLGFGAIGFMLWKWLKPAERPRSKRNFRLFRESRKFHLGLLGRGYYGRPSQ